MLRQRRTRLRDVPALPLLYLLHAIFTLASLVLRLYEALTSSPSAPTRDSTPPKRVALVLSTTPHAPPCRRVNSSYGRSLRRKEALRRAAVGSVLRAVRWAAAEGVEVVSVYEPSGTLESARSTLLEHLLHLPPSPPASGPSSPPQRTRRYNEDDLLPDDEEGLHEVGENSVCSEDARKGSVEAVVNVLVHPDHLSGKVDLADSTETLLDPGARAVTLLLLSPDSDIVLRVTRDLINGGISPNQITQELLNAQIEAAHYPPQDLLIIHPLEPQSFWRSLLPRPAPELGGYPFWPLRITEIYQHPAPLPLSSLAPLLSLARRSSLPFLRKLGYSLPILHEGSEGRDRRCMREGDEILTPAEKVSIELDSAGAGEGSEGDEECWEEVPGVLRREEWEGAMAAWSAVEQRLGR